jgi:hypothetical protein
MILAKGATRVLDMEAPLPFAALHALPAEEIAEVPVQAVSVERAHHRYGHEDQKTPHSQRRGQLVATVLVDTRHAHQNLLTPSIEERRPRQAHG